MLNLISFILVMIGSLNWLLVGLFQFDLVAWIFGSDANVFARIIYGLVGLAALILLYSAIVNRGHLDVDGDMHDDHDLMHIEHHNNHNDEI